MTRSISTSGIVILSPPDGPRFEEPWQAEALALAVALQQAGYFSASEWAAALGAAIRRAQAAGDPDDGSTYYGHVLDALEQLVLEKSLSTGSLLAARKEAWRAAFARTPHGKPVTLE
jgi:nitrile hydratase accessory protein